MNACAAVDVGPPVTNNDTTLPPDAEAVAEAVAALGVDPHNGRRVRVRWRTDNGEVLIRLCLPGPGGDVRRWRRWNQHDVGGDFRRGMSLCAAAVRAAAAGDWSGWSTGDPPFFPFLHHPVST